MTIRRRVKSKWHKTLGDFHFKKATYHPNGKRTFDVWYKNNLIGECRVTYNYYYNKKTEPLKLEIRKINEWLADGYSITGSDLHLGNVHCFGWKNSFPTDIVFAEIFPDKIDIVFEKEVLFEKKIYRKPIFVSPGVFIRERD